MEIQIMKIYDMVEGKWVEDKKVEKEKEFKNYENFGIGTRLITYDEEQEWVKREKDYVEFLNKKENTT